MSLSRVDAASHLRGLRSAETGLDLNSFRQRTNDPKEYIRNSDGGRVGFFHNFDNEQSATLEGHVTAATIDLVMGVAFGTSLTVANAYDGYGVTAGNWYLEDIETVEAKGTLADATVNVLRVPGMATA